MHRGNNSKHPSSALAINRSSKGPSPVPAHQTKFKLSISGTSAPTEVQAIHHRCLRTNRSSSCPSPARPHQSKFKKTVAGASAPIEVQKGASHLSYTNRHGACLHASVLICIRQARRAFELRFRRAFELRLSCQHPRHGRACMHPCLFV